MAQTIDPKEPNPQHKEDTNLPKNKTDEKKTDPNMTELRGFVDDDEKLEPEGTDNPDVKGMP